MGGIKCGSYGGVSIFRRKDSFTSLNRVHPNGEPVNLSTSLTLTSLSMSLLLQIKIFEYQLGVEETHKNFTSASVWLIQLCGVAESK